MTRTFLRHIRTEDGYDFYKAKDVAVYNIVPSGSKIPTGGYAAEYILAIKLNKVSLDKEQAEYYFLGAVEGRVFNNVNFKKRDYNCSNVVAVEILEDGKVPVGFTDNYAEEEVDLSKLTSLYTQNGVRYWGYL